MVFWKGNKFAEKHWLYWTRFYRIWDSIKARCTNKKHIHYKRYWWNGIKCEFANFEAFKDCMYENYVLHIANHWEKNTSIDRINASEWYNQSNCRRSTRIEQNSHKESNILYEYNWEKVTLNEIARREWKNIYTYKSRKKAGRNIKEIIQWFRLKQ